MRRRILVNKNGNNGNLPDGSKANVCDVVFANKNTKELIIVEGDKWSTATQPKGTYEPIGIVVIPGGHGVLKDGTGTVNQCGIMSIVPMNYSTPEKGGSSEQQMYWGYTTPWGKPDGLGRYDSTISGFQRYDVVCHVGNDRDDLKETIQGTDYKNAYLPSDNFDGIENPYDSGTSYTSYESMYFVPSPYKNDGSYNPIYGQTTPPSSERNVLSDFRGIVNTKMITDVVTVSNWKSASTIDNSNSSGNYPAACCCARFKTTGTKSFVDCTTEELKKGTGFWYLPSMSELGYVVTRLKQINQTISALNSAYGVGVQLDSDGRYTDGKYWASTEHGSDYVCIMNMHNGYVGYDYVYSKYNYYYVRAFMRL